MALPPTVRGLAGIAGSMPVANQQLAAQQQAARDLQLQAAVRAATPAQAAPAVAQQLGTAVATQAGASQVAQAEQAAKQSTDIQALGQQIQQLEIQQTGADRVAGLAEEKLTGEQQFAAISEQAKQELYDSRRDFASDQQGLSFRNERQLADYAKLRARTDEDFRSYQQKVEQVAARKSQTLATAQARISQQLELEQAQAQQLRDQASTQGITERERDTRLGLYQQKLDQITRLRAAKQSLVDAQAKEQAETKNRLVKNGSIGSIVGAVAGGVVGFIYGGGPVGAAAGASAGASLGQGAGTLLSGNK